MHEKKKVKNSDDTHVDDVVETIEAVSVEEIDDMEIDETDGKLNEKLKQAKDKLKDCTNEKQQLQDDLQRTKADFLNAKKRLEDDKIADRKRTQMSFIESILPLADSFQMAMANKDQWESVDQNWRVGVEGIYTQLKVVLETNGVTEVNPSGETFDPNLHEAVGTTESDQDTDTVVEVVQVGYEMAGSTIRPAKVIIST